MTVIMYSVLREGWGKVAQAFLCFCGLDSLILILSSCKIQGGEE